MREHTSAMEEIRTQLVARYDGSTELANAPGDPATSWQATATSLIDAVTGLMLAPVTPP